MLSLLTGVLLGTAYALSVKKWAFRSSDDLPTSSRGSLMSSAAMRLLGISVVLFALTRVPVLDIAIVLLSFITCISLYLLNMARKAIPASTKTRGAQSQGSL